MIGRLTVVALSVGSVAALVALLVFTSAGAAAAQQDATVATVGVLGPGVRRTATDDAFERALHELGRVRNQNVRIETRYWGGRPDAVGPLAAELVALRPDVLVAWGGPGAVAAKRAAGQIPVVFLAVGDPVRFGLVTSLARPGGHVTGVTFDTGPEIDAKRLALLKEVVPGLARVALLVPSDSPRRTDVPTIITTAKQALNLDVREIEVSKPPETDAAIRRAREQGAQALSVWTPSPALWTPQLSEIAIAQRLPTIHWFRGSAEAGGLMSYAPSLVDIARRGATYVDRILKGARPADLPVEQPTRFELVVNLRTAKALGLRIPQSLRLQADAVVE